MAAMLTTRKALPSTFLHKFISPVRSLAAPTAVQSFTTNVQRHDLERDRSIDIDCRGRPALPLKRMDDTPSFFADLFDTFIPANLTHMMNMMEQIENLSAMERGMGGGARRAWDVKEEDDALYLRIDLPGLGKEDVKVSVEGNTLIIKGEGEKESESDECGRKYSSRIDLPPKLYKLDQNKAEMKNGVLRIVVPKMKEEERKDIFQVQIE
ncbi:small heat shock protein, chloroplastic-like protein isoform X2 [Cinnamomum micranthum f. kanehirae]|uniref:Small heat shock protein, chloroplastic-like protein isoform X2 n=1 Tax=Cinnamomum micranthum f. kanehirae TaxID=337451 RepID=A0A3S3NLB2_9MAGN|nr:small heat shock protein, chloroplastic-like protein isoform X2 [Cinnamomum micranthum f. kanehirae]